MPRCEVCGTEYDQELEVRWQGATHRFDCFDCAVHALAPLCAQCGARITGHAVEEHGAVFCSMNCAEAHGAPAPEVHMHQLILP